MITLEEVLSPRNMLQACDRVITNKGAPGVDDMRPMLGALCQAWREHLRAHPAGNVHSLPGASR